MMDSLGQEIAFRNVQTEDGIGKKWKDFSIVHSLSTTLFINDIFDNTPRLPFVEHCHKPVMSRPEQSTGNY